MRAHARLTLVALAILQVLGALTPARAADLVVLAAVRHRGTVVADYDGTPIYLRHSRRIVRNYDGVEQAFDTYDAYPVLNIENPIMAAVPTRYLNGQPVR
jgi:hypothetical protein